MAKAFRALREDFVVCCRRSLALEPAKQFQSWMKRAPNHGLGNKYVASLRDGGAVPAYVVNGLVSYALDESADGSDAARAALRDYCIPRGIPVVRQALPVIVESISIPVDSAYGDPMKAGGDFVGSPYAIERARH